MVVKFVPPGNLSNICAGVEGFEANRPKIHDETKATTIAFCVIFSLISISSILAILWFQNYPRFRKIRPKLVSIGFIVYFYAFTLGILINAVFPLPCMLFSFSFLLGHSGVTLYYLGNLCSFVAESEIASKCKAIGMSDDSSNSSNNASKFKQTKLIMSVLFLFTKFKDLSIEDLYLIKRSYYIVAVLVFVQGLTVFFVLIALVPQFVYCSSCYFYGELILADIVTTFLFFPAGYSLSIQTLEHPDPYGVRSEALFIIVAPATVFVLCVFLTLFDPGLISYYRIFMWEWIFVMAMSLFWCNSMFYQWICAVTSSRKRRFTVSTDKMNFWRDLKGLPQSEQDEFSRLVTECYSIEHLHFCEDVFQYKKLYYEKDINWRVSKSALLYRTYIQVGSLQQVNISNRQRDVIEQKLKNSSGGLEVVFDDAVNDVMLNVLRSFWLQFNKQKRNKTNNDIKVYA